jgi:P-type Cu2+ transporter
MPPSLATTPAHGPDLSAPGLDTHGERLQDLTLRLSGLHCAGCAASVETALRGVAGVRSVSASYAAQASRIQFDPRRTDLRALLDAVRRAGYGAALDEATAARELRRSESRTALWRAFVAVFCAMQVMMLAVPFYVAEPGDIAPDLKRLLDWGAWLLTLPVLVFSAAPFFSGAWRSLRARRIGMDVPVALGIVVTFIASTGAALNPAGVFGAEVYFDSLTMFVSFLLLGRWFEMRMRHRAAMALEAASGAMPETAWRLGHGGRTEAVAIELLRAGDRVRVPVGQAFPADGVVLEGASEADEALLSGESKPVAKPLGAAVLGGSINLRAPLVMRVERCGADTRYQAIVSLMRDAATQRPATARWADRWAGPFLWTVLLLAALGAWAWSFIDPPRAVWVAVSVLIVTCPCALSLATPAALLAAAQALARRGVLLRRIDALQPLAGMQRLFLDKTGTLTTAKPRLARIERLAGSADLSEAQLLRLAASLAAWSSHPVSLALREAALGGSLPGNRPHTWHGVREQAGAGVEAIDVQGWHWRLGHAQWIASGSAATGATPTAAIGSAGSSEVGVNVDRTSAGGTDTPDPNRDAASAVLGREGQPVARFHFDETLADGVAAALAALRADGVALTLLSGDAPARVQRLARRLDIDAANAIGGATPERKLREIEAAQARGEIVGMVGDGINDAPVLARADVSLAMGEGALLARANADAVIVSNRLADVVHARAMARRTLRIVRQNIAWAAGYNALSVPLALFGALPPWAAGLGMAASSLLVVGNSLRLQRGNGSQSGSSSSSSADLARSRPMSSAAAPSISSSRLET